MDDKLGVFGFGLHVSSANAFNSLVHIDSRGVKRKLCDVDGIGIENASLVLGLGRPLSSSDSSKKSSATACTMSSAKETEDGSSMDLRLKFDLNLGNENMDSTKRPALDVTKTLKSEPNCDLQLSLSVGPSESAVTSIAPVSVHHHFIWDKPTTISQVSTVHEGSTSCRWKHGNNLSRYLNSTSNTSNLLCNNQMNYAKSASVELPGFSSSTVRQTLKSSISSTSRDTQPQQRNNNTKNCQTSGCTKGARGASGRCIAHGGGQRCRKAGCDKGAEGRTIFCKAHGGGKQCQYLGCTKSAEGCTNYCISHGGGRRCIHEGCTTAARGKSGLCIRHGGGKRCQKENCTKSAEGRSGLCISHGGGRRCQYPECAKGAQGSTYFCKAHGGGKRCTYLGCKKGAEGSTPFCKAHGGGKRCAFQGGCTKCVHGGTQFCVAHGGGKRCAVPECTKSARGRTNYCVRHGGGKRCKAEGCGKSAQGSTDFCKAHGGGKRCSWGRPESTFGTGDPPCEHFARGKIGVCDAHIPLIEDRRVHGECTLVAVNLENPTLSKPEKMKEIVGPERLVEIKNGKNNFLSWCGFDQKEYAHPANAPNSGMASITEGRVHGGSLMAMLASYTILGGHSANQVDGNSECSRPYPTAHNWV